VVSVLYVLLGPFMVAYASKHCHRYFCCSWRFQVYYRFMFCCVQPVDTYLVCGEKGKALDLRDVYDVAVNPEVIYAVNADLTGQLLTKVRVLGCL
jgi:hypothetical protein